MSFVILMLAIMINLILPWLVGCQLRVLLTGEKTRDADLSGAARYSVDYAYGMVLFTYIYIALLAIDTPTSQYLLSHFGQLIFLMALVTTVIMLRYMPRLYPTELGRIFSQKSDNIILYVVTLCSLYVTLVHPYVFDSAQLLSIIQYVNPFNEFQAFDRGMVGYSSLILVTGTIFSDYPIPFIASSEKVPLGIIFLASITVFAKYFRPINYQYSVVLLSLVFISSSLGLHGFATLGKDSIIGIAFMWLFVSLWLFSENDNKVSELDLVFVLLAAATTGIITIPYVFIFLLVVALAHLFNYRLWQFSSTFLAIGAIPLAWVLTRTVHLQPLYLSLLIALGAVVFGVLAAQIRSKQMTVGVSGWALSFIPISSLAALFYLLPLTGNAIDPVFNYQWSTFHAPLDDKLGFISGVTDATHTETWMSKVLFIFGWAGVLLWAFTTRSPAVKALAAMPFLVLLFAVLHAEYDWHLIRYRLLWDLYKDIPQWMSGLYVGLGILAILDASFRYFNRKIMYKIVTCFVFFLAVFPIDRRTKVPMGAHLFPIATFNSVAGHRNKLMASILEYNTKNPEENYVLFPRGVWPGPTSFSRSFGYDSYIVGRDDAKITKAINAGETGIMCFKSTQPSLMEHTIGVMNFSVTEKVVIDAPPYVCDRLVASQKM